MLIIPGLSHGIEVLGGEITWKCAGGNQYIFELTLYRDCNSPDITSTQETIRVWNHPSVSNIDVNFVSRVDISPTCTQNSNSPVPLTCGGSNSNGLGAVEKFIFQSNALSLSGTPPIEGWIFTYESTSRKTSLTNILNPGANGMTIVAKIFAVSKVQNTCLDNSPLFLENPYMVVCSGTPYLYMPNVSDPDLDSLAFKVAAPLNNFPTGTFDPPTNPVLTSFTPGFSATSPTPGITMNGSNTNFQIDPLTGDMSFSSASSGQFVIKFVVESYRNGRKIAENEREMVVFVVACSGTNTSPVIAAPIELGSSFSASFPAGSLIDFNVISNDVEFLQDGTTPQQNFSSLSGIVFSSNFTASGVQGSTNHITWQTSCADLKNSFGNEYDTVNYSFVVKVIDNYCQIPKVSYQRIQIQLTSDIQISPAQIQCIQTQINGDLLITWDQVSDPNNDFVAYELYSVQNGLLSSFPDISSTSFTVPAVNINHDFFVKTLSGSPCTVALSSDTVSNIFLNLFDPLDGTAVLTWNSPFTESAGGFPASYEVFREYPTGTWTSIGFVPYGTNKFTDTIDICSANLNYYVALTDVCTHTSSIIGALLSDRIAPYSPEILSVSIDTLTGFATINWTKPNSPDVQGYIIYFNNVEFDTVFGINNTSYIYSFIDNSSSLNFSVAAFDSCSSQFNPLFNQTSGRSTPHTTMFLSQKYDICSKTLSLSWSNYIGWQGIEHFEIFGYVKDSSWRSFGVLPGNSFFQNNTEIQLEEFQNYTFVVQAKDSLGNNFSFSNPIQIFTNSTSKPTFNYLKVATVLDEEIQIKHEIEFTTGVSELALERKNSNNVFEEIQRLPMAASVTFFDDDVNVAQRSYSYQVRLIDSCGNPGAVSNVAKTILLTVQTDHLNLKNFLSWSDYQGFNGSVLYYNIYRGVEGVFNTSPFATVSKDHLFFEDTAVPAMNFNGQICYYIEAVESMNIYAYREISRSNVACPVFTPIVYVPNAFTPNGDEFNQVFLPSVNLVEINDYHFTIFDRWGQVIFQTNSVSEGWDGTIARSSKIAPNGTYMYVIQLKDGNQQELIKRGHVSLLH